MNAHRATPPAEAIDGLVAAIEDSLSLIAGAGHAECVPGLAAARGDRWLQQWLASVEARPTAQPEPLRTAAHFACSGGTLISKCIAALPNVQLLSEVDPLSSYVAPGANGFTPTDLVALLRQSSRGASRR